MHGLVRVSIAAIRHACRQLARHGVTVRPSDFARNWSESLSGVERAITLAIPGVPFVTAVQGMYLKADRYQPMTAKDRVPVLKSA